MNNDDYAIPVSTCSMLLVSLQTARRLLCTQIDDAKSKGMSSAILERDLGDNRDATRHVLSYLKDRVSAE
jgi:CRISPR/Cas system Type II protein with McrA/HNH and RuvC-like nuclease domain